MDNSHPIALSVVVLSHNRPVALRTALASILAQTGVAAEVMLLDNRSPKSDEIRAWAAGIPQLTTVFHDTNLGYAAAMNRGVARARKPWVFLTEDDIELEPGCLRTLVRAAEQRTNLGLAAPLMLNRGDRTIRFAGGQLRLGTAFGLHLAHVGERDRGQLAQAVPTDFAPGAALLGRREVLRSLGPFREDFFMYLEDVELCLRLRRSGLACLVVPEARVLHHEPACDSPTDEVRFHKLKNLFAVALLHAPKRSWPAFFARYGFVRWLQLRRHDPTEARLLAQAVGWTLRSVPRLLRDRNAHRRAEAEPDNAGALVRRGNWPAPGVGPLG